MSTKSSKNKINTRKAILARSYVVFALIALFGIAVLWKAAGLMLGSNKQIAESMKKTNRKVEDVPAMRGNIYAEDGSLLATTVPRYELIMDPMADGLTDELLNTKLDSLCHLLAQYFPDKNKANWLTFFKKERKEKSRYALVAKDLGFDIVKKMKTWPIINLGKFKGFYFEEKGKRLYFMGDLAQRSIGSVGNGRKTGLEGAFDSLLAGHNGKRLMQKMPGNVWRPLAAGNNKEPENGYDIVTTLDVNLQDIAQNALKKTLALHEAENGCVMIMEVKTGAVKAIANLMRGTDGSYYEGENFAVNQFTEPGSTFKLISTMALLEDGYCKPSDSVDVGTGTWKYFDINMVDASRPFKRIYNLEESFEYSSNVGISKLVHKHYKNQPEKFINHIYKFGLQNKPEFDIKASSNPLIKSTKSSNWASSSLLFMSIGYEVLVSPLQTLMVYNTIANNGKQMKPFLVSEIRQQGRLIKKIEPKILSESVCSPQTASILKKMMEGVVEKGTAKNLKIEGYKVAGKTGTSQIAKGQRGYDKTNYKSSFCGYFPADNPQYTVIVVINKPKKGEIYGALVAGPVFKEIAEKVFSKRFMNSIAAPVAAEYQVPSVLKGNTQKTQLVLNQLNISSKVDSARASTLYSSSEKKGYVVALKPVTVKSNLVPDVKGMGIRDAIALLESYKISVTFSGVGKITNQSISAGTKITANMKIHLNLE